MLNILKGVDVGVNQLFCRSPKEAFPCLVGYKQITPIGASRLVGDGTELCIISHMEWFKERRNDILISHNARV